MISKNLELTKQGVLFLLILAIFGCSAHSKNELRRNDWR